jgi:hypothetical protein
VFWPSLTAVLALNVLVAMFLLWRKVRQIRPRFLTRDPSTP